MNYGIIIGVLLANLIVQPVIWAHPEITETNMVDCYDKHNNKILGLECEKEYVGISPEFKVIASLITALISTLFIIASIMVK